MTLGGAGRNPGSVFPGAAMKLPYAYRQALAFLAACAALGSALGVLIAVLRGRIQPGRP